MIRPDYYGRRFGRTRLELGWESDDGTRLQHRVLFDQEAYDTWHLAGYLRELLASRRAAADPAPAFDRIPRPDKHVLLYLLLAADPRFDSVFELGASLLEVADGLAAVDAWVRSSGSAVPPRDLGQVAFAGAEISALCAEAAVALHPQHHVTIYPHASAVDRRFAVLYDRIVSGSAFETAASAAAFFNRFDAAVLNLFVSKGETFVVPMVGRAFTYFSLVELLGALDRPLYHLFGERAPRAPGEHAAETPAPVVEGFFLMAEQPVRDAVLSLADRDPVIREFFAARRIAARPAAELVAAA